MSASMSVAAVEVAVFDCCTAPTAACFGFGAATLLTLLTVCCAASAAEVATCVLLVHWTALASCSVVPLPSCSTTMPWLIRAVASAVVFASTSFHWRDGLDRNAPDRVRVRRIRLRSLGERAGDLRVEQALVDVG